jgi:hypothetical protein
MYTTGPHWHGNGAEPACRRRGTRSGRLGCLFLARGWAHGALSRGAATVAVTESRWLGSAAATGSGSLRESPSVFFFLKFLFESTKARAFLSDGRPPGRRLEPCSWHAATPSQPAVAAWAKGPGPRLTAADSELKLGWSVPGPTGPRGPVDPPAREGPLGCVFPKRGGPGPGSAMCSHDRDSESCGDPRGSHCQRALHRGLRGPRVAGTRFTTLAGGTPARPSRPGTVTGQQRKWQGRRCGCKLSPERCRHTWNQSAESQVHRDLAPYGKLRFPFRFACACWSSFCDSSAGIGSSAAMAAVRFSRPDLICRMRTTVASTISCISSTSPSCAITCSSEQPGTCR